MMLSLLFNSSVSPEKCMNNMLLRCSGSFPKNNVKWFLRFLILVSTSDLPVSVIQWSVRYIFLKRYIFFIFKN